MQTEFIVRGLESFDLEALLTLYTQLHPQDDPLPPLAEVEKLWSAILLDPSQIYFGAFVNGVLVSACNATVIANLTRGARPYAVIENVVTDTRFRRRKIGSAVLRQLLDQCWNRHCYKVMLMSSVSRSEIHEFYV